MIWGKITHSYAHMNWTTQQLISGASLSLREGANQHNLTEEGTTGIYSLPAGMVAGTLYTLYDNGTGTAIQWNSEDQQWYYDPNMLEDI